MTLRPIPSATEHKLSREAYDRWLTEIHATPTMPVHPPGAPLPTIIHRIQATAQERLGIVTTAWAEGHALLADVD